MGFQRGASVASGGGPANQAWSSVARKSKVNIPSQLGTITESPQTAGRQAPPVGPLGTAQGPWANAGRTQVLTSNIGSKAPSQTSQVRNQLSSRVGLEPISWTNALKSVDDVDGTLADPDDSSNSGRKPCLSA
ncbi:hypothetical protein D0864_11364 [Hortaea werneckii]|uniref:Uncharacterized protein n=1 Tax=Hortaea werneckii TaxID=91943 RepID=A0A3M7DWA8_HORWE|nr:hypothetical protein D0864_11364 [Hortaea werneckii]